MLHWLGIRHSDGFDTPYIASICCFEPVSAGRNEACGLLKQHPRPDTDSSSYLVQFSEMMLKNDRPFMAHRLLERQIQKALAEGQKAPLNSVIEASKVLIQNGDATGVLFQQLATNLIRGANGMSVLNDSIRTEKTEVAKALADVASLMYRKSDYEIFYPEFQNVEAKMLKLLSNTEPNNRPSQREEIKSWLSLFSIYAGWVKPPKDPSKLRAFQLWDKLDAKF
jgi:hypothetical protein